MNLKGGVGIDLKYFAYICEFTDIYTCIIYDIIFLYLLLSPLHCQTLHNPQAM